MGKKEQDQRYRGKHRVRIAAYKKQWALDNPEKIAAARERAKAKAKQMRRDNPSERMRCLLMNDEERLERKRARHRKHMREAGNEWREKNPDRVALYRKRSREKEYWERRDNPSKRLKALLRSNEERTMDIKNTKRESMARACKELRPSYLRSKLGVSNPELLEVYKLKIQIKRYLKENML